MATSTQPSATPAGPSSAGATGSEPERDPQQETVTTAHGVKFLHAGSGNSLGDGRTAGGSANVGARGEMCDTPGEDHGDDGSASCESGTGAEP